MTDQNNQNTESQTEEVSAERQNATVIIANEFLSRATLGEALSQVSLNALIQLSQNKAFDQAKQQVAELKDDQVEELLAEATKKAEEVAEQAVNEVTPSTEVTS
tara:strand:- start:1134 stop:1445 length:312 start_codon:yes stop_codon:yes gene_type:complete